MPRSLPVAFAVSVGLHLLVLFGADVDFTPEPPPPPLLAELRLPPPPPPIAEPEKHADERPAPPAARRPAAPPRESRPSRPRPPEPSHEVTAPPEPAAVAEPAAAEDTAAETVPPGAERAPSPPPLEQAAVPSLPLRLPSHGVIRFRVDRGDSGFEIGAAYQEWEFTDGRYRLRSVVESTGLIRLLRTIFIEMESLGRVTETGLQPEVFAIRRETRKPRERALFDWESMRIRVGNRDDQPLDPGAQDLLSLYYQLAFLDLPATGETVLPVATGKKYSMYRLEVLGDEKIETPIGVLRTLHLRAPGENMTEFWLAYDYRKLPVKIRHVDSGGGSLVQVATEIQMEP